jgi:hypothetical protein
MLREGKFLALVIFLIHTCFGNSCFSSEVRSEKIIAVKEPTHLVLKIHNEFYREHLQNALEKYFEFYCQCDEQIANLRSKKLFTKFVTDLKNVDSDFYFKFNYPSPDYQNDRSNLRVYHFKLKFSLSFVNNILTINITKNYGLMKPVIEAYMSLVGETDIPVMTHMKIVISAVNNSHLRVSTSFKTIGNLTRAIQNEQLEAMERSLIGILRVKNLL